MNILLHYGKYRKISGERVKIIKNDGLPKCNNIVGKIGVVTDFEYLNFGKPIVVYFDTAFRGKQNGSSSYVGLKGWKGCVEVIGNIYESNISP